MPTHMPDMLFSVAKPLCFCQMVFGAVILRVLLWNSACLENSSSVLDSILEVANSLRKVSLFTWRNRDFAYMSTMASPSSCLPCSIAARQAIPSLSCGYFMLHACQFSRSEQIRIYAERDSAKIDP